MPDCEISESSHGVVPRPCTQDVTDRNWDEVIDALDKNRSDIVALQACFTTPIVDAIGLTPFRLTATLALGGTAAAVKRTRSAGSWVDGDAIVVKDLWNCGGRFWGRINDIGMAWKDPGTDEYFVTDIQTIARSIRYTVLTTTGYPTFSVTVNDYWNGCDPGATVDVYDARGLFQGFHCKGCTGYGEYNEREQRYEIRDPQLMSLFHKMEVVDEVCISPYEAPSEGNPSGTAASITGSGTGDILESYDQAYYSATPYDATDTLINANIPLDNPFFHVFQSASQLLAMAKLNGSGEIEFQVIDAKKTPLSALPSDGDAFTWDTGSCALGVNTINFAAETCGDSTESPVPIPFGVVDMVDSFELIHGTSPDSCTIVAHTHKYCMIDHEDAGADIDVAVMTEREVLIDWYLDYVAAVPPLTEYYAIKLSTEKLWVPCYNSGTEIDNHHLLRRDIIDDFDTVHESSPESCKIIANTKQTWVFDLPDPAVAGDDIEVISFVKREVVIDIDVDSTDMTQDTEYHWVPCYDAGTEVLIVNIDPCE